MNNNEDGFFLAELLLSLSILLIISTLLVPMLLKFSSEQADERAKYFANNLLYERLLTYEMEQRFPIEEIIEHGNDKYIVQLTFKDGLQEVCVNYRDNKKVCEFIY